MLKCQLLLQMTHRRTSGHPGMEPAPHWSASNPSGSSPLLLLRLFWPERAHQVLAMSPLHLMCISCYYYQPSCQDKQRKGWSSKKNRQRNQCYICRHNISVAQCSEICFAQVFYKAVPVSKIPLCIILKLGQHKLINMQHQASPFLIFDERESVLKCRRNSPHLAVAWTQSWLGKRPCRDHSRLYWTWDHTASVLVSKPLKLPHLPLCCPIHVTPTRSQNRL